MNVVPQRIDRDGFSFDPMKSTSGLATANITLRSRLPLLVVILEISTHRTVVIIRCRDTAGPPMMFYQTYGGSQ